VALEQGEHRDTITYAVAVGIAAPLAIAAICTGKVVLAGPVGRSVGHSAAAASGAPPPSTVTATSSPPRAGVAPDVPPGSRRALGRRRRLGELAVEVGAREAIAPPGAPVVADLPDGR
jgi:hypothetical protein